MMSTARLAIRKPQCALLAMIVLLQLGMGCNESKDPRVVDRGSSPVPRQAAPPPAPPRPAVMTVAPGTALTAVLRTPVATGRNRVGDPVELQVEQPVHAPGGVAIPAGATVLGQVTHINKAGRVKGAAEITLRFQELVMPNGKHYAIGVEPFRVRSKGDGRESAAEIGGGAAAGGILGGVLGGKDKALPGAAIGAILGTGVAVATKGQQISLAPGQRLQLRFTAPVDIVVAARN